MNRSHLTMTALAAALAMALPGCSREGTDAPQPTPAPAADSPGAARRTGAPDSPAPNRGATRRVPEFKGLIVRGSFVVEVRVGAGAGDDVELHIEAPPDQLARVFTTIVDDSLTIMHEPGGRFSTPPTISFTVADLTTVTTAGSSQIRITGVDNESLRLTSLGSGAAEVEGRTDSFNVHIAGSAEVTLRGQARRFDLDCSGSGAVRAKDLRVEEAGLDISGSGRVELCVTGTLDASVSGSGEVSYFCDPAQVTPRISGAGRVGPG
ncbi:head GIN domain-containing protein [Haliangium sp.]|uniref:head GIN domain-containing protein n=1 Tax=Haliangium sp. TaxID=2663208 RepID=UPI003D0C55E7